MNSKGHHLMGISEVRGNKSFNMEYNVECYEMTERFQAKKCSLLLPVVLACSFILVSCFAYSSTLKRGATYSSKAAVGFQQISQLHVPEIYLLLTKTCRISCIMDYRKKQKRKENLNIR
jgi:hypothetical protein